MGKTIKRNEMKFFKNMKMRVKQIRFALRNPGKLNSATYIKYPKNHDFEGRRVLNLGCGSSTYPAKNVIDLDMYPHKGIDVVHDLSKTPLPFKDNEFDLIVANHILEHVPDWWECFVELSRIVKVGGIIEIWLPGDGGSSQLGYRDHINVINHNSFTGMIGSNRNKANAWEKEQKKTLGNVANLEFKDNVIYVPINLWWIYVMPHRIQIWMMTFLRNCISEMGFKFIKTKHNG